MAAITKDSEKMGFCKLGILIRMGQACCQIKPSLSKSGKARMKHQLKISLKSFRNHIDPEKEEQLNWTKIEIDDKVRRTVKLIKSINQGNKEVSVKKKAELIQLIDDFHTHYQSLYALYDNLKGELRKKISAIEDDDKDDKNDNDDKDDKNDKEDNNDNTDSNDVGNRSPSPPSSSSDTEAYYSPDEHGGSRHHIEFKSEKSRYSNMDDNYLNTREIVKEALDLDNEPEQSDSSDQKLVEEFKLLKVKLGEKEKEQSDSYAWIKELEEKTAILNTEVDQFRAEMEREANEAKLLKEENLELQAKVLELETTNKERENGFDCLLKKSEAKEKSNLAKIKELSSQVSDLQTEVDTLAAQNVELEKRLLGESNQGWTKVKELSDQINTLQHELESLRNHKTDTEILLDTKSHEMSECLTQLENIKEKLIDKTDEEENMEVGEEYKIQKSDLEEQIIGINHQTNQSRVEKEVLQNEISKLEGKLSVREGELFTLQKKIESSENDMSNQIIKLTTETKNLSKQLDLLKTEKNDLQLEIEKEKLESAESLAKLEEKNGEMTNTFKKEVINLQKEMGCLQAEKIELQLQMEREKLEAKNIITKLEKENTDLVGKLEDKKRIANQEQKQAKGRFQGNKSNLQITERKMEEMAEEFFKKFEDNLRILSRRIRVAEQLHIENKEWYSKTKDRYEQERRALEKSISKNETGLRYTKDISLLANNMLIGLEIMALRFDECSGNFINRTSNVSCELKFAKDWVRRKNKAILHVKEDLDCLLSQLDDKEAEILVYREKVWKCENRVRELEKIAKEKGEGMMALKEEKREAIRQLCVQIDYHRSRSDHLKKMVIESNASRNLRTP